MSDEQNALVAALDKLPAHEMQQYSEQYFDPEDDANRVPSFDGRFFIAKVKNDSQRFDFMDNLHEEMSGVIVDFHLTKTWYQVGFDESGGGNKPDCYSNDSITPLADSPKKQADKCALCLQNKFIPDQKRPGKKKKECRDTITLYIWNPRFDRPVLLRVSTMNRKRVSDFIKGLGERKIAKELVAVKLSLFKDSETADVAFSGLKITPFATVMQMIPFFQEKEHEEFALQWFAADQIKKLTPKMLVERIVQFKDDNKELFETEGAVAGAEAEKEVAKPAEKHADKPVETPATKPTTGVTSPPASSEAFEPDEVEESESPF